MVQQALSSQMPPLIGRQAEATDIRTMLTESPCRLLTLIGPGGIGKTTLAIHVADRMLDDFRHGIAFVPLQPVHSPDIISTAVADALGFSLAGTEEPLVQVCHHLRDKELLLVLDNFEHLLAGLDVLVTMLQSTPAIKMLVTSREALNLREEWLYPVSGLVYPQAGTSAAPMDYAAVQLFSERARRVRRDFSLEYEYPGVARICQLVEGLPLALELAATWAKTLRSESIAVEIEQDLDFLSTRLRDLPQRHHSMKAVFEHSWALLADEEQKVFKHLCIFRGGFAHQAAVPIAGASLPLLAGLVDKSLLRWGADDRYQVHELLRQYAQEKLEESPADVAQTRDAHCRYYAAFLYARWQDMSGGRQREATAEIAAELDNIRSAWQWALESHNVDAIVQSIRTLGRFDQFRSRYREGAALYAAAIQTLEHDTPSPQQQQGIILLLVYLGWLSIRLGRFDQAQATLERCRDLYAQYDGVPLPGDSTDPDAALGIICLIKGDYAGAIRLGEASRRRNTAHNRRNNLMLAYYVLTGAALAQGAYPQAHNYAQQAYAIAQESEDRWFMAYCLIELGQVELVLGNYDTAAQHFRTSYGLRREFDDAEGMALALKHLGQIALLQGEHLEAQQLFSRSRSLYEEVNDRGGLASALEGLGTVACALGEHEMARQHFHKALQIAVEIEFVPLVFSLFIDIGELFVQTGKETRGINLLVLTSYHPASGHEAKDRAGRLLARYRPTMALELRAPVLPRYQKDALETLAASLLAELALSAGDPARSQLLPPAQPGLVEPLTQRELEVLWLLAQGLSNQHIAETLIVSIGTIKAHNHSIFAKLGTTNRTQAVARARELHLL